MLGSLRKMHFGFLISVIVAVLIIGISRDATAQTPEVECPCDFESVPLTAACWTDNYQQENPGYSNATTQQAGGVCLIRSSEVAQTPPVILQLSVADNRGGIPPNCAINAIGDQNACSAQTIPIQTLTPEEVLACQCELLAYTTALNEVAGISVFGGPPYECGNVVLRDGKCQVLPAPIPTLNEYGMIITAGVLGLLAVIGLFVMRTRRTVAGGRGPDGANQ